MEQIIEVHWYDEKSKPGEDLQRTYASKVRLSSTDYCVKIAEDECPGIEDVAKVNLTEVGLQVLPWLYGSPGIIGAQFASQFKLTVKVFGRVPIFDWDSDGLHERVAEAIQVAFATLCGPTKKVVRVIFVKRPSPTETPKAEVAVAEAAVASDAAIAGVADLANPADPPPGS
jgi:hypothetical protein